MHGSRNFCQGGVGGGGGVQARLPENNLDNVVYFVFENFNMKKNQ